MPPFSRYLGLSPTNTGTITAMTPTTMLVPKTLTTIDAIPRRRAATGLERRFLCAETTTHRTVCLSDTKRSCMAYISIDKRLYYSSSLQEKLVFQLKLAISSTHIHHTLLNFFFSCDNYAHYKLSK